MDQIALKPRICTGSVVTALALVLAFAGISRGNSAQPLKIQDGYIFIDGAYLSPPYQIEDNGETLTINGQEFTESSFDLSGYERRKSEFQGWRRGSRSFRGRQNDDSASFEHVSFHDRPRGRNEIEARTAFERFSRDLHSVKDGTSLVLFSGQQPFQLAYGGYDLLSALTSAPGEQVNLPEHIRLESDKLAWHRLVTEFQPNAEFENRAREDLDRYNAATQQGEQVIAGSYWMEKLSYPLTVFAMAVVVLGFGHLLSNKPKLEETEGETTDWSKHRKVVGQSLLIVGLLSAIDLIWTIGATNAGTMRELNPMGSKLISDPVQLFLFKATLTGTAVAILYALHRRPIAQLASWWCCLLLTLLTARWVVFQSMFM